MATTLGSQSMPTRANEPDGVAAAAQPAAAGLATSVVINERTTVAMAYALAQFLDGSNVRGNGSASAMRRRWSATWST